MLRDRLRKQTLNLELTREVNMLIPEFTYRMKFQKMIQDTIMKEKLIEENYV